MCVCVCVRLCVCVCVCVCFVAIMSEREDVCVSERECACDE